MRREPDKGVVLKASPDDIDRIEKKILVEGYVDKGLMTNKEWNRTVEIMGGDVTKQQAEQVIQYFLGTKDAPGVIEVRRNSKQ